MAGKIKKEKTLDQAMLKTLNNLSVVAKTVVEGVVAGRHKTPYHGFNLEFAQHRQYFAGDDLRHINWKIFGKSDKLNIKLYEEETDLKCYMLVDSSASMAYSSGTGIPKFNYAAYLATALAYILVRQQDRVGMSIFDEKNKIFLPPKTGINHLGNMTSILEKTAPEGKTNIPAALHTFQSQVRKRGLLVLVSDMLESPELIIKKLKEIRHKKHEVIVFQILDRDEIDFPFRETQIFRDLETGEEIAINPMDLRQEYIDRMQEMSNLLHSSLSSCGIDYVRLATDQDLLLNIRKFLTRRASGAARK